MTLRRRRRRGFTLIEVMVALGVMTIGAMALLHLLSLIIRGNTQSRQLNTAMAIGTQWVDRLKEDAHTWTQAADPTGAPTPATVLASTLYLRNVAAPPSASFTTIPASTAAASAGFDYQGRDIALPVTGNDALAYCAAYRANWIYFGKTMHVDVRVFWAREGTGANIAADFPNCGGNQALLDPGGALASSYHVIYMPTVISVTPVIR